uniref:ULP_PROTEASE domain-containing protein n=2 Tax=Macrostomum lignano TaxID=282301 RepID=A0A1I8HH75_9PLAT
FQFSRIFSWSGSAQTPEQQGQEQQSQASSPNSSSAGAVMRVHQSAMPSFSTRSRTSESKSLFVAAFDGLRSAFSPRRQAERQQRLDEAAGPSSCSEPSTKRPRLADSSDATQDSASLSIVQRVYLQGHRVPALEVADDSDADDVVIVEGGVAGKQKPKQSACRRRSRRQSRQCQPQEPAAGGGRAGRSLIGKFTYRPREAADGITVTDEDAACLRPGEYFNDVIVDFYLKYMQHCLLTPEQRSRTHVFNCFFYKRLTRRVEPGFMTGQPLAVRRHASVAKWTRRVDLFDKDFILVPINESCHWFLAVICFPELVGTVDYSTMLSPRLGRRRNQNVDDRAAAQEAAAELVGTRAEDGTLRLPCILVFDSLSGTAARTPNVTALRDYLQVEWDMKRAARDGKRQFNKDSIRGYSPVVPQQPNAVDCGPYMLHYAEMLFRKPIQQFTMHYFENQMRDWFQHEEIDNKRSEIKRLLVQLYQKIGPDPSAPAADRQEDSGSDGASEVRITAAG